MSTINNIIVCGVGAAGANTLMHLVYAYPDFNYTVVDDDIVEDRNVTPGTQPYTKTDMRRPKVQSLQRIVVMAKKIRINAIKQRINSSNDIRNLVANPDQTLIIDAFDNAGSRNIFCDLDERYNVVHIGFSAALTGEMVWNDTFEEMEEEERDDAIDVCEMSLARPFIFALCAEASMAISRFVEKDEKINFYLDTHFRIKHW